MLNACAEAHAFASLTQWKGGILGVLLQRSNRQNGPSKQHVGFGIIGLVNGTSLRLLYRGETDTPPPSGPKL